MRKRLLIALLLLAGCARQGEEAAARAVAPTPTLPSEPPSRPRAESVGERLQQESGARASGNPRAESVISALQKAGLQLRDPRQHAAAPMGALFCIGAQSENNVSLSVCEYEGAAAARAGRELSVNAFKSIPNRDVWVNRSATLTLLQSPRTSRSETEVKRAVDVFKSL